MKVFLFSPLNAHGPFLFDGSLDNHFLFIVFIYWRYYGNFVMDLQSSWNLFLLVFMVHGFGRFCTYCLNSFSRLKHLHIISHFLWFCHFTTSLLLLILFFIGWPCSWGSQVSQGSIWFQNFVCSFSNWFHLHLPYPSEEEENLWMKVPTTRPFPLSDRGLKRKQTWEYSWSPSHLPVEGSLHSVRLNCEL